MKLHEPKWSSEDPSSFENMCKRNFSVLCEWIYVKILDLIDSKGWQMAAARPMMNLVNYSFSLLRLLDSPSEKINVFDLARRRVISGRRILWEKTLWGCFKIFQLFLKAWALIDTGLLSHSRRKLSEKVRGCKGIQLIGKKRKDVKTLLPGPASLSVQIIC